MWSTELFIARRLFTDRNSGRRVSKPAITIAICGMAIGLVVMIVSICVVVGFKHEIRSKIIGFGAHLQVYCPQMAGSLDQHPVEATGKLLGQIAAQPGVRHVQRFSTKMGITGGSDSFHGFVLKGVGQEYDLRFFGHYLVEGELPQFGDGEASGKVVLSKSMAQRIGMKVGDKMSAYFIQDNIRARKLEVAGIFETHFAEFDNNFMLTDLYTVNRLNGWKGNEATGIEVLADRFDQSDRVAAGITQLLEAEGSDYLTGTAEELYPNLFDWLNILDTNVWVILVLILGVAGFTMISGLLILILERTNMIGVLKSMGAQNIAIRKIFLIFALQLIVRGMVIGDCIGIALCLVQQRWGVIKLDPSMYYLDRVPVEFNLWLIVLLNVGMFIVSVLMLVAPSALISHIRPTKAIRFE